MSISILRTADAWFVQTSTGAARIATSATSTHELLTDRAAIDADNDAATVWAERNDADSSGKYGAESASDDWYGGSMELCF